MDNTTIFAILCAATLIIMMYFFKIPSKNSIKYESVPKSDIEPVVKTKDVSKNVSWAVLFLCIACVDFYLVPWGQMKGNATSEFGHLDFVGNKFTGFNLGLFSYSYPLTVINILLIVFITLKNTKAITIISFIGFIGACIAVYNNMQVGSFQANFGSQLGSVSSSFEITGYSFALPVAYFMMLVVSF